MATPTFNLNYDPNARYDSGPNAAACGKTVNQGTLQTGIPQGNTSAGVVNNGVIRTGFSAAGVPKNNAGPNAAGAPRTFLDVW